MPSSRRLLPSRNRYRGSVILLQRVSAFSKLGGQFLAYEADMPRLVFITRNGFLAFGITDDEAVFRRMRRQPLRFRRTAEAAFRRAFAVRSGHVDRKSGLVLAMPRPCAVFVRSSDSVFFDIVVIQRFLSRFRAVARHPSQRDSVFLRTCHQLLQRPGSLLAKLALVDLFAEGERNVRVDEVIRHVALRQAELLVDQGRHRIGLGRNLFGRLPGDSGSLSILVPCRLVCAALGAGWIRRFACICVLCIRCRSASRSFAAVIGCRILRRRRRGRLHISSSLVDCRTRSRSGAVGAGCCRPGGKGKQKRCRNSFVSVFHHRRSPLLYEIRLPASLS
ncbi:hypothetical protein BN871_CZ_00400 [Paenibacillus sp. P22]|nr:hypothetical protein BN871_CZ_00400 [Paenibacillus sp. P22]